MPNAKLSLRDVHAAFRTSGSLVPLAGSSGRWVNKDDVRIQLQLGATVAASLDRPWLKNAQFNDQDAFTQYVEVLFSGVVVERVVSLVLDAGEVLVPYPEEERTLVVRPSDFRILTSYAASRGATNLARFQQTMRRLGMTQRPDSAETTSTSSVW